MVKHNTDPLSHEEVLKIREDFPILKQQVNEHPLVYLDNAATTQKPQVVIDTLNTYYREYNSNVHRGIHALSEKATYAYEEARQTIQHFLHAKDFREIVFCRGATEAINMVATSFVGPRIQPGEEILVTYMEHHSNIVPWQMLCSHTGAILQAVPIEVHGELDMEELKKLINPNTKFLALTHVSNTLGTINPIKEIIKLAHDNDCLVLIDGCQAVPHMRVNVRDLDCDFYTFSGHKLYGPTGIGVLYGKEEYLDMMSPYQGGGEMISHVSFEKTEYAPVPQKFEAGTPNIAGAIGLASAIDYVTDIGLDRIAAYETQLYKKLRKDSENIRGIGYIGSAQNKAPIFTFVLNNVHAHDVGTVLNSLGIAVRSGHLCTIPIMDYYQEASATRAAISFYNTEEEVEALLNAINQVESVMGKL